MTTMIIVMTMVMKIAVKYKPLKLIRRPIIIAIYFMLLSLLQFIIILIVTHK